MTGGKGLTAAPRAGAKALRPTPSLSPKRGRAGEAYGPLPPSTPGFPVGPTGIRAGERQALSVPSAQCQQRPGPVTTQRSTEQPPAASPAHGPCLRPSRAVCGRASRLLGRAGVDRRPGKSRLRRSEQGRAGEERRAARSLAGASGMRGYRAPGACCLWKAAPCRQCLPAEPPQGLPTPTR